MAPHLVRLRARSTYQDTRIHSFYHACTHTHTHVAITVLGILSNSIQWNPSVHTVLKIKPKTTSGFNGGVFLGQLFL